MHQLDCSRLHLKFIMAVANTTVTESLKILKGELTRTTRYGMSEKERYECVKREAKNHPCLEFEEEETNECHENKTKSSETFDAITYLEEELPASVYQQLSKSDLEGLSQVMNEKAGVDGLGTLVYNSKWDFREVTEFSVMEHVGGEESQIRIHYVKITAEADCKRVLAFSNNKMELKGEHRVSTFTAKNNALQSGSWADLTVQRSLEYLAHSDGSNALRM